MEYDKKKKLENKGWKTGTVAELLGLTQAESDYIEIKVALTNALRFYRNDRDLTQHELAKRIKSSQSRVAKMEAGDPTVTIDLLLKSILSLDVSTEEVLAYLTDTLTPRNAVQFTPSSTVAGKTVRLMGFVFSYDFSSTAIDTPSFGVIGRPRQESHEYAGSVRENIAAAGTVNIAPQVFEREEYEKYDA